MIEPTEPIPFNRPAQNPAALKYIEQSLATGRLAGDHEFTKQCSDWLFQYSCGRKSLLTTSGTHALEMAAILAGIGPGDEVIMPSFTFSSTANAFVSRGAKIVFIDIRPDTMNLDEKLIAPAMTSKTRAIVPVHYGGVGCEMGSILALARKDNVRVIEDAAQALLAYYDGKPLGTLGDAGCFSFHETKNISCGEGGALMIQHDELFRRAEIIREKGTDRAQYFRGERDKYSWVDFGSSYLPSDLISALLYSQFEMAEEITANRLRSWKFYQTLLKSLVSDQVIEIQVVPENCKPNAHLFFIKVRDVDERTALLRHLKANKIGAVFHYVPLHSSIAGRKFGTFVGEDKFTTRESERLIRLPLFYGMTERQIERVVGSLFEFFKVQLK